MARSLRALFRMLLIVSAGFPSSPARAQTDPGLSVTVTATVTRHEAGLWTYEYEVRNDATSTRSLHSFTLEIQSRGLITSVQSPEGWTFGTYSEKPFISWAATEGVPPSPFQLAPGRTVRGFFFQSALPPTDVRFFAEGFVPLVPVADAEDLPPSPGFLERTFHGTTQGPSGASPACDGQGSDFDGDGVCDSHDNCRFTANADQRDSGGAPTRTDASGAAPDGVGDACQCGDPSNDGRINQQDVDLLRSALVGLATVSAPLKCSVTGSRRTSPGLPTGCDVVDLMVIQRAVLEPADPRIPGSRLDWRTCPPGMP
jgi:hypothetical protein